ncbi:tetratricopeptide repeat protein [Jidongwangia harbinensis]|uniref:tetratricopeptide repeat protein n=1 Tax=Jidongwangia harbinensis TaxID=2878561 RepID=UPI001CD9E235|nr:tetratricopeptide repeat protein [Jidongwangia harbinensis]MCA2216333.1 hypothetical protein [Jidongwangia harbinensis]MCA2217068.1 hypothetical protein [Jidongwangia harbinensis]
MLALVALVLTTTVSFLSAWFFAEANLLNGMDKVFSVIGGTSGIAALYLAWKYRGPLTGHGAGHAPSLWPRISLEVPGLADGEQIRGRDTLIAELIGLFDRHATNTKRVRVLHGMGGAGKTTIARHVGQILEAEGVVVWFVSAAGPTELNAGMRQVAERLNATAYELAEGWNRGPDVLWRLIAAYSKSWLLIVDNADDPTMLVPEGQTVSQKQGWIRPVNISHGAIIVTSRDSDSDEWGTWCELQHVGMLSTSDSAQVLLDLAGTTPGTHEEARALADRLGGLPLALRLAGHYLGQTKDEDLLPGQVKTFAGFHAALDSAGTYAVFPDTRHHLADRQAREVIAQTWELSLTYLERGRSLPDARNLLRLLSVFADAPIPFQNLLDAAVMAGSELFPGLNPRRLDESRDGLIRLGLLDVNPAEPETQTPPTWRLHPLVRDASLYHLTRTGQTRAALALAARLLERAVKEHENQFDTANWPFYRLISPHPIQVLARAAESPGPEDRETIAVVAEIASEVSRYVAALGQHPAAVEQAEMIRSIATRTLSDSHPAVIVTASADLASFTGGAGDIVSARDQYAALIPIAEHVLGPEHPETLLYRSNLAWFTGEAGDVVAARDSLIALLRTAERVLKKTDYELIGIRSTHARFVGEAGDAAGARDLHLALVPLRREVFGRKSHTTLVHEAQTIRWTGKAGDPASAHNQLSSLISIMRDALGPSHRETLQVRSDLAYWTGRIGDPVAARDQLTELVPRFGEVLGPEHPETVKTRVHLAYWTGWAGNPAAARDQLAELLPVLQRVFGVGHRATLIARSDLARWIGRSGDPAGARDQLADLLPVLQRVFGAESLETLKARGNLAYWAERA